VYLEASTKPHVLKKIHEFLINMAFTMAYPNFKKGLKMAFGLLGVKMMHPKFSAAQPRIVLHPKFHDAHPLQPVVQFMINNTIIMQVYTIKVTPGHLLLCQKCATPFTLYSVD
jgi:hypothetical protein